MNEDEPTPLHTKYFVDNVRSRKEPSGNIEVGVRATTVALHRQRRLLDRPQAHVGRREPRAFRAMKRPIDTSSARIASPGIW